jgi:hypothetical protein
VDLWAPLLAFLAFAAIFSWQARRSGMTTREWLDERNRRMTLPPGWWRPGAIWMGLLVVGFIVAVSVEHGWRWQYLIVIPLFGGVFALGVVLLSWMARRRG